MPVTKETFILQSIVDVGECKLLLETLTRQDIVVINRMIKQGRVQSDVKYITLKKRDN